MAQGEPFGGRVAIVTGGASGIGAALCQALAGRRAHVVLVDRDAEGAAKVAGEIESRGGRAEAIVVDVTDRERVETAISSTAATHGRVDYLFNCAGMGAWGDARDFTDEQWRTLIDVNLWGVVYSSLAAYRLMARQGSGHIVNIASLAGLVPVPATVPYAAAKHAVVGLTLSLRAEAAALGVRCSVVCPGPVRSAFHGSLVLADPNAAPRRPPAEAAAADVVANSILCGVARNRAVIVVPRRAWWTWLAWRCSPRFLARAHRRIVESLRASQQAGCNRPGADASGSC